MKKGFNALIVSTLGVVLSLSIAVAIKNTVNVKPVQAASHPNNYARYTYSGSYYSSALATASEGMDGGLRTALTSLIHPTSVPTYGSAGETHLSTVLQYADEDPDNSQNMIYLYTRDSVKKNAASSWNREHVWPQSLSNNCWGTGRAGTDLLHLRPTYNTTNSTRGNDKYGNISGGTTRVYNGITYGYSSSGKFMPLDSVKGDVARIIMYVWTSYHDEYGSKLPAITNVFESFDTLMEWHTNDKPDIMEGNRNNYAETQSMQHNRNPFVDHPEYAWKIFGSKCSSSVLSAAKAAYPADGSSGGDTPSTYVTLDKSSSTLTVGGTLSLTATSSDSSNISWSTTNSTVASISNNSTASGGSITVTANAAGNATIYAQNTSGAKAYCSITVESGSGGSVDGDTVTFDLSQGTYETSSITWRAAPITITQTKGNGSTLNNYVDNPRVYKGNILSFAADSGYMIKSISIPYNGSNKGNGLTAGTVISNNTVTDDTTNISRTWSTASGGTHSVSAKSSEGLSTIHIQNTCSGENIRLYPTGFSVTLVGSSAQASSLKSIAVSGMTQNYYVGDTFSFDGTCTATYEDDSTKTVKPTSVSSPDMTTSGNKTITISYTENNVTKTTTYTISVVPVPTLSNIAISGTLSKTSYYSGDTFDPTGLTVTATYTNGSTKNVTSDVDWTPSPLETGNTSVTATYQGKTAVYNGITVAPLTLSSIILSGQTTTFEINDEFSFDGSVLATYTNGSKRQVEPTSVDSSNVNMSQVGTYSVRVSYTENGVTKNATYTISVIAVPFINSIEQCYEKTSGTVNNVYGLYVGAFNDGESSIIMNGEFGVMLYRTKPSSTWVENQTYLCVTSGTISVYKNLHELNNSQVEEVTNEQTIREKIAPITTYNITGSESENDLTIASRLCLMTGTVTSIKHGSENGYAAGSDNTIQMNVNGNNIQLFVKKGIASSDVGTALTNSLTNSTEITIKGFTGFYTTFQVQLKNLVVADSSYTAEMFAQELLNLTNSICSSSANKESDLSGVWLTLELDKWPALTAAQQQRLINADANKDSSDVIEQAMARYDQICKKYASCTNFIGREDANNLNNRILPVANMNYTTIIIVTLIGVTISISLLGFFMLRKKRKIR